MTTGPYSSNFSDLLDALKNAPVQPAPGAAALTIGGRAFPATAAQAASGAYPMPAGSTMTGSVSPGAGFERPAPTVPPAYLQAEISRGMPGRPNVAPASLLPGGGASTSSPGLMDPNGKPQTGFAALPFNVRSAMLGNQFGLDPKTAHAMTDNLYYHPENSGVLAGTPLDPTVNRDRRELTGAELALRRGAVAETDQKLQQQRDHPGALAEALPSAAAGDYSDALLKYIAKNGHDAGTMSAFGELARSSATQSARETSAAQREAVATGRASVAEDKLTNAKGSFKTLNDAVTQKGALEKAGQKGVNILPRPGGTYEIEVRSPQSYAPDATQKVQTALDLANEDVAAAQTSGDAKALASAQARADTYTARLKHLTSDPNAILGMDPNGKAAAAPAKGASATAAKPAAAPAAAAATVAGTKVSQGGVQYEFDGKKWNAVK